MKMSNSQNFRKSIVRFEIVEIIADTVVSGPENTCMNTPNRNFILSLVYTVFAPTERRIDDVAIAPGNTKSWQFVPPVSKSYMVNHVTSPSIHQNLYFYCNRVGPNDFEIRDNVVELLSKTAFSYSCVQCYTTILRIRVSYRFSSYPTTADIVFRSVNTFVESFTVDTTFCTRPLRCQGVTTDIYCIIENYIFWRTTLIFDNTFTLRSLGINSYNRGQFRTWNFYFEDDLMLLYNNRNTFGIGAFQSNTDFLPCFLDRIVFTDVALQPYQPLRLQRNGLLAKYTAISSFYFSAYRYSGINSRFKCDISNNFTTCLLSTTPKCANIYKNGPNCAEDNSNCMLRPCIFATQCDGIKDNRICKCLPGAFGDSCENFTCNSLCLNARCTAPNKCEKCIPGWGGPFCNISSCNEYTKCGVQKCKIDQGVRICDCDTHKFFGKYCQITCNPACVHGICNQLNNVPICVCDNGFFGIDCNSQIDIVGRIFKADFNFFRNIGIYVGLALLLLFSLYILQIKIISVGYDATSAKIGTISMNMINKQTLNQNLYPVHQQQQQMMIIDNNINQVAVDDPNYQCYDQVMYGGEYADPNANNLYEEGQYEGGENIYYNQYNNY